MKTALILKLSNNLRSNGYNKAADELEYKYLVLKKAETNLYSVINEVGQDLIDAAHPEGSHKLVGVDGDSVFETISDQKEKIQKIVEKQPIGKLSNGQIVAMIKNAGPKAAVGKSISNFIENIKRTFKTERKITDEIRKAEKELEDITSGEKKFTEPLDMENSKRELSFKIEELNKKSEDLMTSRRGDLQSLKDAGKKLGLSDEVIDSSIDRISELSDKILEKELDLQPFIETMERDKASLLREKDSIVRRSIADSIKDQKKELQARHKEIEDLQNDLNIAGNQLTSNWEAAGIYTGRTAKEFGKLVNPFTSKKKFLISLTGSEAIGAWKRYVGHLNTAQIDLDSQNLTSLYTSLKEMVKTFGSWTVDHPAMTGVKELAKFLGEVTIGGSKSPDFTNLNPRQLDIINTKLLDIERNLLAGNQTYANVTAFIPVANIVIPIGDHVALNRAAASLATNVRILINSLSIIRDANTDEAQKLSKILKENKKYIIGDMKRTHPEWNSDQISSFIDSNVVMWNSDNIKQAMELLGYCRIAYQ